MTFYNVPKNRKRVIVVGAMAAILSTALVGGTFAGLNASVEQEGHQIHGDAIFGLEFLEGSGLINANVSPNAEEQTFELRLKNGGNLPGTVAFKVIDGDKFEFSDAMLDETKVTIQFNESYGQIDTTLRDFLTTGYVGVGEGYVITPGTEMNVVIKFTPTKDATDWDSDDLGEFSNTFRTKFTLSASNSEGVSDLAAAAKANGTLVFDYRENKQVYAIPAADIETYAETGITGTAE
ncbi:hypothetical protein [Microbacterium sp. KR10-403]|uniref:hypothetical protein n=1 Tax=Microbacterium sp. KR10-403 TaxID=3158581 RepID=UPI0032E44A08